MLWWRWPSAGLDVPIWAICERTDRLFWSEPTNALTSLAFLVVAALGFRRWRLNGADDAPVVVLLALTVAIGLGSLTFHTAATRGALLADVVPIQLFTGLYFFVALRRFLGRSIGTALALTFLAYAAALLYAEAIPWRVLNGYGRYLSAVAILFGLGLAVLIRSRMAVAGAGLAGAPARRIGRLLLTAASIFGCSVAVASLDRPICRSWPVGLHPLWHLLNAAVVDLMLQAALRARTLGPSAAERAALDAREAQTI